MSCCVQILRCFAGSALAFLLAGCAGSSPMRIALTELGTVSDSEYGAYGLRMVRSINVTGLGPEEVVGTVTTDPDKWSAREQFARFSPDRSDLPDSMTPRLTEGKSFVVERSFCAAESELDERGRCTGGVQLSDLTALRDQLVESQALVAAALRNEVKAAALAAALQATAGAADAQGQGFLASVQSLYPDEDLSDRAKVQAKLDGMKAQGLLLDDTLKKIRSDSSRPGIFVTRWEREVEGSAGASADKLASASAAGRRKVSGFLILGEPRVTSLQLGDDLLARKASAQRHTGSSDAFRLNRNYITYYQLRARYVLYAESLEQALQLALQADISKVTEILGDRVNAAVLQKISLKIQAVYAAITAASGRGLLDAQAGRVRVHDFSVAPGAIRDFQRKGIERSEGTVPVISIRAAFDDFIADAKTPAPSGAP